MGLFDSLFGKADKPISDPTRLWNELFAAVHSGDSKRLERLAKTNQAAVMEHFPSWKCVPVTVRADPAAVQGYAHTLITVAQLFAQKYGRPELLAALIGSPESNQITRWQSALGQARELMDALRYQDARALLTDALIDSRGMSGSGVDSYLPITHGFLAECAFHSGVADQALPHFEQALALCERSGDTEGIVAYVGSLFEAHRYLAHPEPAADYADRMAALLDARGAGRDLTRWRTRAKIVRAEEPLNRIVAVVDGATFEVDEVHPVEDIRVQFNFERNRITLRPAAVRMTEGEARGSAGQHEEALAAFREAAAADPFDPHCRYLEAFTLLHLERYADAADGYRRVEELAPGWFQCRADLWLAEQLAFGGVLHLLENGPGTPTEKVVLAEKLLARRPILPPVHLQLGRNLAKTGREDEARRALRAGLDGDSDVDVRTRLLTELATLTEEPLERTKLFREAMSVHGNLVSAASAALALRVRG